MSLTVPERLARLREAMSEAGVSAYLIPSTDPHQSEYVPDCWQRRAWISGFTGSAGDVVVTREDAGLWTDSRYFLQAEAQLAGTGIRLFKAGLPEVPEKERWIGDQLKAGEALGVDPRVVGIKASEELVEKLEKQGIDVRFIEENLVDAVWADRPPPSDSAVEVMPETLAGQSVSDKLDRVRTAMAEENVTALVVTALDSIAWLYNLRGSDVDYNPVFIAYAVVTVDGACLFVDRRKLTSEAAATLAEQVDIRPYEAAGAFLEDAAQTGQTVWLDETAASRWVADRVGERGRRVERSPIVLYKATKNDIELDGIRRAHLIDGVAMVRFIRWLEETVGSGEVTEKSAAERLLAFRREGEGFVGPSFPTISGYGAHGAIVHYSVTEASNVPIGQDSLYLVDSGGQYRFGTTDITRTLCFGTPTDVQREMYTRVLRGHIELATLVFPKGTTGRHVDLAARRPLWEAGRNYLHGTGHGIGHYLNVHEGPVSISARAQDVELAEGHVLSNEPGYYEDGEYGIRTENLVTVVRDEERSGENTPFFRFETLSRCPIDTRLILPDLLGDEAVSWLNAFHDTVRASLSPLLSSETADWLAARTEPIR